MKTALYRIWGNDDQLLYVGISKSALSRLGQHLTEKSWAADIVNVTIETYSTRELAAAAEVAAIKTEKPLHNVVHNGKANKIYDNKLLWYGNGSPTRGLVKGQYVALGMKSGKCPVGHIYSIEGKTDPHLELDLKSWVSGYYDAGMITVRISDIQYYETAGFDYTGYVHDDNLAEFQTYWTNWYKDLDRPWPWGRP